ncbi:MAG: ornithine cyclodeaminase family protein [Vicinamibacterales bacterium]|jgi:ornithine cyclodeaminase|nr:ornithine cyclodeaminase [Acidobacteriota bacterium]MDP7471351.1 ornithine cyclodeaminase family protein [Vicinamibacterales bacterium]MDP7672547.1 ornithine cyclodeaminase family protein [Vicinamibacterales bacterium]HJO39734.1 ornithine cyclodeaminase family protein [Vicinamibacterales bacterium]|tara:strand:+ start:92 stop:1075 length:984 start_codon:yes stop_codon:yes gene_type:complete
MSLLILSQADVERALPMAECIEVMADALAALARGESHNPLRFVVRPPRASGLLGLMPAHRAGEAGGYGLKAVVVEPENPARGLDAHQGGVLLFDDLTGRPTALVNASAITAIRTAAVSAVATRLLARDPVDTLAILGAGVQARSHLDAMLAVRRFRHVRVCSRRLEQAERFAAESHAASIAIEPVAAAEAAVRGADVVVTATSSKTPVLNRDWLAAGTHVNAVGSSIPKAREIDGATMAAASLYVDRRESTLNESGDYLAAAREDLVGPDDLLAELGEVLTGQAPGRQSEDEITLFKSLGLAVEDLAAAQHAVTRARALGLGRDVEF